MYLDDILKYKRVCVACTANGEYVTDTLLQNVANYIGNCTIVEEDNYDPSVFKNGNVVCFKTMTNIIKKGERIPYNDNFIIFKSYLHYTNISNPSYQLPSNILYDSDLVFYIYDNQIKVVKDRDIHFVMRDKDKLYKEITINDRIYKLNKIIKRNEKFTNGRKENSLHIKT